jgi:hypothetical protein
MVSSSLDKRRQTTLIPDVASAAVTSSSCRLAGIQHTLQDAERWSLTVNLSGHYYAAVTSNIIICCDSMSASIGY